MNKLKFLIFYIVLCLSAYTYAQTTHTGMSGTDTVPASFFRDWYHRSDIVYYFEALNDHTIVETHVRGQWWIPERLNVAVNGLPFTTNRYYIDGVRIDDVFSPGNTVFNVNMQQYDLHLNTHNASLYFQLDTTARDYVLATYNFGQVGNGEPAAGTAAIFQITHRSPMESADTWKHITARRHQTGAGTIDAAYTIFDKRNIAWRQHLYAVFGQRLLTKEDEYGLILDDSFYKADYYKVQADGNLPIIPLNNHLDLGYRLNFSGRQDAGSEYLYNYNEVYDHKNYTAQLYLKHKFFTTALTYAADVLKHDNQEFSKNIIDQDGESFYPWVADGQTHSLSWNITYNQPLLSWLSVHADARNSLLIFSPDNTEFVNSVYKRSPVEEQSVPLYDYHWQNSAFNAGLLENTIGLKADYTPTHWLRLNAHLDFTFDAILLDKKTKIAPNWQVGLSLDFHPCRWFEAGVTIAHERIVFNSDYLRFFSNDYMNARIYYAGTSTLFSTTGGKYHNYQKGLMQTSFAELQIPVRFCFGRHEIVLQNNYRKFFNVWYTRFASNADDYGFYRDENGVNVWYQNPGEVQYLVGTTDRFGNNFLLNSPYYFSQLTRYTYNGKKVLLSVGWQSMQAAGYTGLGNGPNSNTMGVLSETTANPNTTNVLTNPSGKYKGVSRMDLDKGYVARIYIGYNICKYIQAGATLKWTDGKPFTAYRYYMNDGQVALLPLSSRGTNPTDGNFGTRHCAMYNIDLHLQGSWSVNSVPMRLNIECYNIYDFCTDLCEMAFVQDIPQAHRASMIMTVPTGIIATFTVDL